MAGTSTQVGWYGVNHLAMVTPDMDATVRFYDEVLGMPLIGTLASTPGSRAPRGCRMLVRCTTTCRSTSRRWPNWSRYAPGWWSTASKSARSSTTQFFTRSTSPIRSTAPHSKRPPGSATCTPTRTGATRSQVPRRPPSKRNMRCLPYNLVTPVQRCCVRTSGRCRTSPRTADGSAQMHVPDRRIVPMPPSTRVRAQPRLT
jgi:hypothetical protein